ncbi:hypothetical protein ACFCYX_02125 [Streptomyces populi]|uniref:hypothetical protein n=1 Tax=Streptomyces populi TaxID=2058924 RepID=UPI0035DB0F15
MNKTRRGMRAASVGAAASALAAGLLLGAAAPQANAASFNFFTVQFTNGSAVVTVSNGSGSTVGSGAWAADPGELGSSTGDTLIANDTLKDGYGIEAHLSTGRIASTRGHNSPYTDKTTGNLPEGNTYYMTVCVVKGTFEDCSDSVAVRA